MTGGSLPADVKRTSALRRVPHLAKLQFRSERGNEGDVCAFELPRDAFPITVEAVSGRVMAIAPGDVFLATPGHRESRRWAVGRVPDGGLVPGSDYWVLSDSGVVGDLISRSDLEMGHLGRVRYLGAVCGDGGEIANIRRYAATSSGKMDHNAPVYLIVGTSSEVGKTTAGVAVLRSLRQEGHTSVIALKATGTSSFTEIMRYLDFGAMQAFDCIDFGLPTTYPSGRSGMDNFFANALDYCLSLPVDALIVESAGDPFVANAPAFLASLKARRSVLRIILAAADALGAIGAKQVLAEQGFTINLVTGPCTDTPAMRERTQALCGVPAINMLGSHDHVAQPHVSVAAASK